MRTLVLVLLAFASAAIPARAQAPSASATHTLIEENDGWRVHGLNRRLFERGAGFTTCLALCIAPDGQVKLASAGHLNPYLNGREVALESGLPLGLDPPSVSRMIATGRAYPDRAR